MTTLLLGFSDELSETQLGQIGRAIDPTNYL